MPAKPFRTKRKRASAERCLRPLGATIDIAPPHVKASNGFRERDIVAWRFTKRQCWISRGVLGFIALRELLHFIQEQIKRLLQQIGDAVKVVYFIFDGELGHNDAMQMVRQVGLHLVSKLRHNSALYFPYAGPYAGRGPRRKYGKKLDYKNIPSAYLQRSEEHTSELQSLRHLVC